MESISRLLQRTKNYTFLTKKNLWKSPPHIFNFNQSKNLRSIKCLLLYIVPRQRTSEICYQMQAGENLVNKDHHVLMKIYIERLWGETWLRKFGLCRQRKIWIAALKFDELCNRKFDRRRILSSIDFVQRSSYAVIILRGWIVTKILDSSVTKAKSRSDLFLFCWLCRGTYVSPRIPSSDFSISNLSCHQLVSKS